MTDFCADTGAHSLPDADTEFHSHDECLSYFNPFYFNPFDTTHRSHH